MKGTTIICLKLLLKLYNASERVSNLENIISNIQGNYTATKSLVSDSEEKVIDNFNNLKCVEQDLDEVQL